MEDFEKIKAELDAKFEQQKKEMAAELDKQKEELLKKYQEAYSPKHFAKPKETVVDFPKPLGEKEPEAKPVKTEEKIIDMPKGLDEKEPSEKPVKPEEPLVDMPKPLGEKEQSKVDEEEDDFFDFEEDEPYKKGMHERKPKHLSPTKAKAEMPSAGLWENLKHTLDKAKIFLLVAAGIAGTLGVQKAIDNRVEKMNEPTESLSPIDEEDHKAEIDDMIEYTDFPEEPAITPTPVEPTPLPVPEPIATPVPTQKPEDEIDFAAIIANNQTVYDDSKDKDKKPETTPTPAPAPVPTQTPSTPVPTVAPTTPEKHSPDEVAAVLKPNEYIYYKETGMEITGDGTVYYHTKNGTIFVGVFEFRKDGSGAIIITYRDLDPKSYTMPGQNRTGQEISEEEARKGMTSQEEENLDNAIDAFDWDSFFDSQYHR